MLISNKIENLIKEKKVTKKYVYTKLGYTASGFDKSLKNDSFKTDALIRLAEILEVNSSFFLEDVQKYKHADISIMSDNQKIYGKIDSDDLLLKIIGKLDRIIELMEKK